MNELQKIYEIKQRIIANKEEAILYNEQMLNNSRNNSLEEAKVILDGAHRAVSRINLAAEKELAEKLAVHEKKMAQIEKKVQKDAKTKIDLCHKMILDKVTEK